MSYFVITRICQDCVDGACVDACPVACIYEERATDENKQLPNQLFIDPEQCICCAACEPVCPWNAIYEETEVPPPFHADVALNALTAEQPDRFDVAASRLRLRKAQPSPEEVLANRAKWATRGQKSA